MVLYIQPSCGHCKAVHGPGHQLKFCNACVEQWYCNAECQKSHWQEHKALCPATRRANLQNEKRWEIKAALEVWAERYTRALTQAGSEALLPSKSHPTRSLLHTFALEVLVRPAELSAGDFEVQSATKVSLARIATVLDTPTPGKFARQNSQALSSPKGLEAKKGKGVEGIMRIMLACADPGLLVTHLVVISKEVVEQRRMVDGQEAWVDQLKVFTAPGVKDYKVGENGVLLAVKKARTRRTKAKKPTNGGEEEAPNEAAQDTQHPAPATRRWTDIIDDDDGELPDLSDWGV